MFDCSILKLWQRPWNGADTRETSNMGSTDWRSQCLSLGEQKLIYLVLVMLLLCTTPTSNPFLGLWWKEEVCGDSGLGTQSLYEEKLGLNGREKIPAGNTANKIFTDEKLRWSASILLLGVQTSKGVNESLEIASQVWDSNGRDCLKMWMWFLCHWRAGTRCEPLGSSGTTWNWATP